MFQLTGKSRFEELYTNILHENDLQDWEQQLIDDFFKRKRVVKRKGELVYQKNLALVYLQLTELPDWSDVHMLKGINLCQNKLTSLTGCPHIVDGEFAVSTNRLTNLIGGPKKVGDNFWCVNNKLTTLEGAPEYVGGDFNCKQNPLKSLKGAPKHIGGQFISDQFTDQDYRHYITTKDRFNDSGIGDSDLDTVLDMI